MAMLSISGLFSIPTAHSKLLYCTSSTSPFSTKRNGLQLQPSTMPKSTLHFTSNKNTTTLLGAKAYEREPMTSTSPKVPKDRMCLPGCDYEHWLIVMDFPTEPKPSPDEMIDTYIKTLAKVVGSEEEAKKRIYAVSTTTYTGFQCLISEELSQKFDDLPGVLWVLPDSYLDVPNKDYGGDKFVDGKVIPRPQPPQSERQFRGNRRAQRPAKYDNRRFQPRSNAVQEQDA